MASKTSRSASSGCWNLMLESLGDSKADFGPILYKVVTMNLPMPVAASVTSDLKMKSFPLSLIMWGGKNVQLL